MTSQPTLFSLPASQTTKYSVYQDRSGNYGSDRWLIWGSLIVAKQEVPIIAEILRQDRHKQNCVSELHFSELPGGWGGAGGHKPRTVFDWYSRVISQLKHNKGVFFSGLAVDVKNKLFHAENFTEAFHVYNRFSRAAFSWTLPWFFKGQSNIALDLLLHIQTFKGESRRTTGRAGSDWDNLGEYIQTELNQELLERAKQDSDNWPSVTIEKRPVFVPLTPQSGSVEYSIDDCELMQLTDLLIGGVRQAITGDSTSQTKLELGSIVGEWMADIRKPPWEQKFGVHRKFTVNYFPGPKGPYSDGELALSHHIPSAQQKMGFSGSL